MNMKNDVKKVIDSAKKAQKKLHGLLNDHDWLDEAKNYAEKQRKEVKKLFAGDVEKVKKFLERERTSLERFQKDLPGEVKKLRGFMDGQKRELEKLMKNLRRATKTGKLKPKKKKATGTAKKKSRSSSATA
jgi:GTP-dependent phosphoenolpyruvate carboxykinase